MHRPRLSIGLSAALSFQNILYCFFGVLLGTLIGVGARDRPLLSIPGTTGEGCGLGLSIVEEIAHLFNASLVLEAGTDGSGLRGRVIFDQRLVPAV